MCGNDVVRQVFDAVRHASEDVRSPAAIESLQPGQPPSEPTQKSQFALVVLVEMYGHSLHAGVGRPGCRRRLSHR